MCLHESTSVVIRAADASRLRSCTRRAVIAGTLIPGLGEGTQAFGRLYEQSAKDVGRNHDGRVPDGVGVHRRSNIQGGLSIHGQALTGFKSLGQADWKVENGEIVGTPSAATGGWLLLDGKEFQDRSSTPA